MGEQKTKKISQEEVLKEAEKQLEKISQAKNKTSVDLVKDKKVAKKRVNAKKDAKKITKKRSKKYLKSVELIDRSKSYNLQKAIELVKKTSYSNFDGSIELSIKINKKKNSQPFRCIVQLPHGAGKKLEVIILDELKIENIRKTKKINFDVAIVSPKLMPMVARIAKILGPKGKMPNPKSGTIAEDPERVKKEIESGKVEIKEDSQAMIHQIVGKVSWDDKKILENISAILRLLPQNKIYKICLSATMGPGIKIKL
jgi:large subunit ribosomal protein L1